MGWKNYVFENPEIEAMAKQRAEICAGCDHANEGWIAKPLPDGKLQEIEGMICDLCDCPLSTMLRSQDEKCKKNKW